MSNTSKALTVFSLNVDTGETNQETRSYLSDEDIRSPEIKKTLRIFIDSGPNLNCSQLQTNILINIMHFWRNS